LYDLEGKKLRTLSIEDIFYSGEVTFSMADLPEGIYLLKVESEDGVVVKKINK
jgi:hypothetical protein